MTQQYSLKIQGEDLVFGCALTQSAAKKLIEYALHLEASTAEANIEEGNEPQPKPFVPQNNIESFIKNSEAKRIPDKITAFAYYLTYELQQDTFSRLTLKQLFLQAKEPMPKNWARDLRWAEKIGWISATSSNKESYYLTAQGKAVVEEKFPTDAIRRTPLTQVK